MKGNVITYMNRDGNAYDSSPSRPKSTQYFPSHASTCQAQAVRKCRWLYKFRRQTEAPRIETESLDRYEGPSGVKKYPSAHNSHSVSFGKSPLPSLGRPRSLKALLSVDPAFFHRVPPAAPPPCPSLSHEYYASFSLASRLYVV